MMRFFRYIFYSFQCENQLLLYSFEILHIIPFWLCRYFWILLLWWNGSCKKYNASFKRMWMWFIFPPRPFRGICRQTLLKTGFSCMVSYGFLLMIHLVISEKRFIIHIIRGKSLLELWVTTFLPDWQPPLIFAQFISNFLCMCSNSMASAHVILK